MVIWLLQHSFLQQLHTYVYLIAPKPEGEEGADSSTGGGFAISCFLFTLLRRYSKKTFYSLFSDTYTHS
jgi:hypothetical protein